MSTPAPTHTEGHIEEPSTEHRSPSYTYESIPPAFTLVRTKGAPQLRLSHAKAWAYHRESGFALAADTGALLRISDGVMMDMEAVTMVEKQQRLLTSLMDAIEETPEPLEAFDSTSAEVHNVWHEDMEEALLKDASKVHSGVNFGALPRVSISESTIRDTQKATYVPFENGVAKCTAHGVEMLPWGHDELGDRVVAGFKANNNVRTSLKHRLAYTEAPSGKVHGRSKGMFRSFASLIHSSDPQRVLAWRSALGYLMNTYKDPASAKAIFFTDTVDAGGGSGKSMAFSALSTLRDVCMIDGKKAGKDDWLLGRVRPTTQIIAMDDLSNDYSPESLFTQITTDMRINTKGGREYYIDFDHAPKLGVTSNMALKGFESSILRRFYTYGVDPHFSQDWTPRDEFGCGMFAPEWSDSEWNAFFWFMLNSAVIFHSRGLMRPKGQSLWMRELSSTTSTDFAMWTRERFTSAEDMGVLPLEYLYQEFLYAFPDYNREAFRGSFSRRVFSRWMGAFCTLCPEVQNPSGQRIRRKVDSMAVLGSGVKSIVGKRDDHVAVLPVEGKAERTEESIQKMAEDIEFESLFGGGVIDIEANLRDIASDVLATKQRYKDMLLGDDGDPFRDSGWDTYVELPDSGKVTDLAQSILLYV